MKTQSSSDHGVRPGFFRDHCAGEIYEHGIRCLDMIRLSLILT